ncbi:MAG TPA: GNAT family N-acetyltransferase [Microscillaceae bacterium]|nr:GNAT family N-acetyltransferase [Microscillaceae bacterium]
MIDSKDITFRPAQRADVTLIVAMLADDALGQTRENYTQPLPSSYYKAFDLIDQDPQHELMVLEYRQEVIGTLQLSFLPYLTYQGGTRAQIEAVRIRQDQRGKGLGEVMFRWAIQRAQERGAHVLQLTTDKKRPEALRFYESLGFVASHEGMKLHF